MDKGMVRQALTQDSDKLNVRVISEWVGGEVPDQLGDGLEIGFRESFC